VWKEKGEGVDRVKMNEVRRGENQNLCERKKVVTARLLLTWKVLMEEVYAITG